MNLNTLRRKRNAAVKARNASRNSTAKTYRNRMLARAKAAANKNKAAVARARVRNIRAKKRAAK